MLKKIIAKYGLVTLIFLFVAILLGMRLLTGNHFRNGAEANALPALSASNMISLSELAPIQSTALFVYLDKDSNANYANTLSLNSKEVFNKETLRIIQEINGPTILIADDPTITTRVWMLLAQKGIDELFILRGEDDKEHFKYEFRPDSATSAKGSEFE